MSRSIIAVEVGAESGVLNLLGDNRDLTGWDRTNAPVVAYDQTGLSGLGSTATYIEDVDVSPATFQLIASPTIALEAENYLTCRIYFLKDAVVTASPGARIYVDGVSFIGYYLNTSTGAVTSDGSGSGSVQTAQANLVSLGGQDWWEYIISVFSGLTPLEAYIQIYPALATGTTAARSTVVGNVELYGSGNTSVVSTIEGTPPSYGEVFLSTESFVTDRPGTFGGGHPFAVPNGSYNRMFEARLGQNVNYSVMVAPSFWSRNTSIGFGSIDIINDDGALDYWREIDWRDRPVTIKQHNTGSDYKDADVLLNAIVERMEVASEKRMRLIIRDPVPDLYKPINSTYPVNSPDTTPDAQYMSIPITFGDPKQCEPILVNATTFDYRAHNEALNAISAVYIGGVSTGLYTPVTGGFKLGSKATARITCDPQSTATADLDALTTSITDRIDVTFDSVSLSALNNLVHSSPEETYKYGYYLKDATEAGTVLDWTVSSFGGWWYVNRVGEIVMGQLKAPGKSLENLLVNAGVGVRDLTGWTQTNIITTFNSIGLDGTRSASNVQDASASYGSIVSQHYGVTPSTNPVTARVWILKDTNSTTKPSVRILSDGSAFLAGYAINTSDGTTQVDTASGSNIAVQTTQRTFSGNDWWEYILQVDGDNSERMKLQIYAARYPDAAAVRSVTIGGVEFYENTTIAEVEGTPPNFGTRTITDVDIISDIRMTPDHAPGLSDGGGSDKNMQLARSSEALGIADFAKKYQTEYRTTVEMHEAYKHAIGASVPESLLTNSIAAANEVDRIAALYAIERYFYTVPIAQDVANFDDVLDTIGQTYTIKTDRYGLDNGRSMVLVGVAGAFNDNKTTLTFWG